MSDEELSGASSSGDERKGARKKLEKISDRELSEVKSEDEVETCFHLTEFKPLELEYLCS